MLVFRKHHEDAFRRATRDRIIVKSKEFVHQNFPQWCRLRLEREIAAYVEKTIELAHGCSIQRLNSIQQLLEYLIHYTSDGSLTPFQMSVLSKAGFDERERLDQLLTSLREGTDITIIEV